MLPRKIFLSTLLILLFTTPASLKVTIKNVSTLDSAEAAIHFEYENQSLGVGDRIVQTGTRETHFFIGDEPNPSLTMGFSDINFHKLTNLKYLSVMDSVVFQETNPKTKKVTFQKDWKLSYLETFETDKVFWSNNNFIIKTCNGLGDHFLMHDCKSPFSEVYYIVNDLPKHTEIKVNFNFHFIDKWEKQQAYLKIDKAIKWTESYHWCDGLYQSTCMVTGVDTCGNSYPDKMGNLVSYSGQHTSQALNFTVGTNFDFEECAATWGIDNVEIYTR